MIYHWLSKNISLELLARKVENFFEEKGFKARIEKKSPNEYVTFIIIPHEKRRKIVTAKIYGKPDDFFIELPAKNHSFKNLGPLMSMFGGGFLVLKEMKDEEVFGNLENEFWTYMEKSVESLREK